MTYDILYHDMVYTCIVQPASERIALVLGTQVGLLVVLNRNVPAISFFQLKKKQIKLSFESKTRFPDPLLRQKAPCPPTKLPFCAPSTYGHIESHGASPLHWSLKTGKTVPMLRPLEPTRPQTIHMSHVRHTLLTPDTNAKLTRAPEWKRCVFWSRA